MDEKIIKKIVRRPNGDLEAEPDFPPEVAYFYPLPKALLMSVSENDIWEGTLGRLWNTGKIDKHGRKVIIRYFIPERKMS